MNVAGIKEIAQITGLSLATVSRVFNDSTLVSPKTKQKVLKAAEQLNYRHNRLAAALRSGKSKTIGVLIPEINNHFFGNVINGIEKRLVTKGYSTIITQSHDSFTQEKTALDSLLKLNVDGILISISQETQDFSFLKRLLKESTPIVFFDRKPDIEDCNVVLLDDFKGGQMATQHLLANGCKNPVHVFGDQNVSIFKQRKEGFLDVVSKNKEQIENFHTLRLAFDVEKDTQSIGALMKKNPAIDGFFCHGDKFSVHTMNILRLLGFDVPNQIKIIGFGNNYYTNYTYPKLSSIDQKCNEMGALAVEMLLSKIEDDSTITSTQILTPELITKNSSVQVNT